MLPGSATNFVKLILNCAQENYLGYPFPSRTSSNVREKLQTGGAGTLTRKSTRKMACWSKCLNLLELSHLYNQICPSVVWILKAIIIFMEEGKTLGILNAQLEAHLEAKQECWHLHAAHLELVVI